MPEKEWTPARIRHGLLQRRYAWGKQLTQIADECGLPHQRLTDVIAGRAFSPAVAATLVGYLTTPAGPAAMRQNFNKDRKAQAHRFVTMRKIKMLQAIGARFGLAPRYDSTCVRNDGELTCYAFTMEDHIKRIVLSRYPYAKLRGYRFFDNAPLWKWLEFLETRGGQRVDPPPRPVNGPRRGSSRVIAPSSLRRGGS